MIIVNIVRTWIEVSIKLKLTVSSLGLFTESFVRRNQNPTDKR